MQDVASQVANWALDLETVVWLSTNPLRAIPANQTDAQIGVPAARSQRNPLKKVPAAKRKTLPARNLVLPEGPETLYFPSKDSIELFIGIHGQDPVMTCCIHRALFLGNKAVEGVREHPSTCPASEVWSAIRGAPVENQNLVHNSPEQADGYSDAGSFVAGD